MPEAINFCARCGQAVEQRLAYGRVRPVCPHCGRIHFIDPKVAVAVVIERDRQILLVQRANEPERGQWSFPAGFVDGGEDPARAAEREGLEETGLTLRATTVLDVFPRASAAEGADFLIVYRAEVVNGELHPGDDAANAGYFGPDDFPALAFPSTRRIIDQWRRAP